MSDNEEDQTMELEALESIFEADFKITSDSTPRSFELVLVPITGGTEDENKVAVLMQVTLPIEYPEVVPDIEFSIIRGLPAKLLSEIQEIAQREVEENVGSVSIFTVAEAVKEFLADNNEEEKTMFEEMMQRHQADNPKSEEDEVEEKEEEEKDEFAFFNVEYTNPYDLKETDLVTQDSFTAWEQRFQGDLASDETANETKPTGKDMFIQNLVKSLGLDENEGTETETAAPRKDVTFYDEDLYGDDPEFDDVGLDDDEDHKEVVSILPESLLEKNELDKSSVAPEVKPTVPKTAKIRGKKKKKAPAAKKKK